MRKRLIDLTRTANLAELSQVRALLSKVLQTQAISTEEQNNILLCFAELTTNIIQHASPAASHITSQLSIEGSQLELVLTHDGGDWQPDGSQPMDLSADISEQTHGRGLGLMALLCPDWHYQTKPCAGVILHWPLAINPPRDKILLVEDDKTMQALFRAYLSEDYQIDSASNGQQAWQMLQQNQYQLVLSDVHMPEMDGLTLREKTLSLSATSLVPFIFISADSADSIKRRANVLAIDDFLVKPIQKMPLQQTVSRVLTRYHQLRRELTSTLNQRITCTLQPVQPADNANWRFSLACRNTGAGGGDLLQFQQGETGYRLLLSDVEGHDVEAKFFAHAWAGYLRGLMQHQLNSGLTHWLEEISNCAFTDQLLQQKLLTLLAIELGNHGHFEYGCAGHPAPILVTPTGATQLAGSGMLPGLMPNTQYQTLTATLAPQQRLLLFTDGLFESGTTPAQRAALEQTLLNQLQATLTLPINQASRHLMSVFEQYATLESDDTLLLLIELNDN